MKVLKKISIVFIVGVLSLSCSDEWDDHFENTITDSSSGADNNLYAYISADEKYSEFKGLVDELGLSSLFTDKLEKTLFLPSNTVFDYDSNLDSLGKVTLVKNYLVGGAKYSNGLGSALKAYSGKWLNIGVDGDSKTVNNAKFDYKAKVSNGLIYEIHGNYAAALNLYEYILSLPREYSKVRDYVLSENDTVFLLEDSRPIDINEFGETIYDSVFVIRNNFIAGANNVMDEDRKFSMFLPNDEVIEEELTKVADLYFKGAGEELEENQLFNLEKWCITSIFYDHLIGYEEFNETHNLTLTNGSIYKIEDGLQEIDKDYEEFSNGRCYNVKKIHIPTNKYMPTTRFDFWEPNGHYDDVDKYFVRGSYFRWWVNYNSPKYMIARVNTTPADSWPTTAAWDSWKNVDGNIEDAIIMPGEYDVVMSVATDSEWSMYDRSGDFRIEFGSSLPEYEDERTLLLEHATYYDNPPHSAYGPNDGFRKITGGECGRFVIPKKYGNSKLRFYVTILKDNGRMSPTYGGEIEAYLSWVSFTPTTNNY